MVHTYLLALRRLREKDTEFEASLGCVYINEEKKQPLHFFLKYLFITCKYTVAVSRHITDGYEPPCGCWELNQCPLKGHPMLLTSELSCSPFFSIS